MKRLSIIIIASFYFSVTGFSQESDSLPAYWTIVPTPWGKTPWNADTVDIKKAESILKKCIETENKKLDEYYRITKLDDYIRQYICVKNKNGERELTLYCLCGKTPDTLYPDWRKKLYIVKGGGKCYFRVTINLDKETYYNFSVNGIK